MLHRARPIAASRLVSSHLISRLVSSRLSPRHTRSVFCSAGLSQVAVVRAAVHTRFFIMCGGDGSDVASSQEERGALSLSLSLSRFRSLSLARFLERNDG